MIKFQTALLAENLESTKLLTHASWLELQHTAEYDPDWQLLVTMEQMGCLQLYQVTALGVVVGAAVMIIGPSTHQKGTEVATLDFIFIRPNNRGVGGKFLNFIEDHLRSEGVSRLCLGLPPQYGEHPGFLSSEYKKTDHMFMRKL